MPPYALVRCRAAATHLVGGELDLQHQAGRSYRLTLRCYTSNCGRRDECFTLPDLPPDFCDAQFAGGQLFSRRGRLLYQSASRSLNWGGVTVTCYYRVTYTDGRYQGWPEVIA